MLHNNYSQPTSIQEEGKAPLDLQNYKREERLKVGTYIATVAEVEEGNFVKVAGNEVPTVEITFQVGNLTHKQSILLREYPGSLINQYLNVFFGEIDEVNILETVGKECSITFSRRNRDGIDYFNITGIQAV